MEELDAVIGGHSHSFLFSGEPPSNDASKGDYPTLVTQQSGKVVPVVQAFWGTKYLGFLKLSFSEDDELSSWNNTWKGSKTPILLDGSHKQGNETFLFIIQLHENLLDFKIAFILILFLNTFSIQTH